MVIPRPGAGYLTGPFLKGQGKSPGAELASPRGAGRLVRPEYLIRYPGCKPRGEFNNSYAPGAGIARPGPLTRAFRARAMGIINKS